MVALNALQMNNSVSTRLSWYGEASAEPAQNAGERIAIYSVACPTAAVSEYAPEPPIESRSQTLATASHDCAGNEPMCSDFLPLSPTPPQNTRPRR
jgi:hypothetical protein